MMNKTALTYDIFNSPLGPIYLVFSGKTLSAVSYSKPVSISFKKKSAPVSFIKELDNYFHGIDKPFTQKIRFLEGTDFERSVWSCLKDIPYGETRSYKWVAEKIGNPGAVRAVGQALSKNPVPIVLPCHRIIESDGSIGGYSSGQRIKVRLLEMEYYSTMK